MRWKCYAKPAFLGGKTCGHVNQDGIAHKNLGYKLICCEECGCTKRASDARYAKDHTEEKMEVSE